MTNSVTYEDIQTAAHRIAGVVHRTPVMTSRILDDLAGRRLFFKCEHLQRVGAFKFRGAWNSVSQLTDEEASKGVVTHSSGNHAQALALAAQLRGIPAHIVMPSNAPTVKRAAVSGYGAHIIECEPTLEARETTAKKVLDETGGVFVHPYDYAPTIAGQGTAALELLEEVPDLDAVIAPVGGGGLMSGTCIAARGLKPNIRLFGAEPKGADDAARSLAAGELIPQTAPHTIADGLLTSLGDLTWPVLRDHLETIITVPEDEITVAMGLVWTRMKQLIEPSSAVPVAAVMSDGFKTLDGLTRVGIIVSGGNVDMADLKRRGAL
jgi:threonine dehydratase